MEYYKQIKNFIITNSPGYIPYENNRSYTGNMMNQRQSLGFTRVFSPSFHFEGEVKIFERKNKNFMFKRFRFFGPRGELLVIFMFLTLCRKMTLNNLEREKVDMLFKDRNVYYLVDNVDKKYKLIN